MILKNVYTVTIAKETYDNSNKIFQPISREKWEEYINSHQDYYAWHEDTKKGKSRLEQLDKVPDQFKEGILQTLNKKEAFAEFNEKEGFYEVIVNFNSTYNLIDTTLFEVTMERLEKLLDLANYMEAYLLINGDKIVTKDFFIRKEK